MSNPSGDSQGDYRRAHIKALDGLRGYAAIIVCFFHAILHIDTTAVDRILSPAIDKIGTGDLLLKIVLMFFNGTTAVMLFYVLSGAVLCQSLLKNDLSVMRILLFLARRVLRLFPGMMVCMGAVWLTSAVLRWAGLSFPVVEFKDALLNAFLIEIKVLGPTTSIQIEALATPFILLFFFLYRKYSVVAVVLLFSLSIVAISRPELVFFIPNMGGSVFVFLAGMLVAMPESRALFSGVMGWQILVLVIFAFIVRHFTPLEADLMGFIAQIILLAAIVGFIRWSEVQTTVHRFLEIPLSQFFGKISYSYYLWNVPVLWFVWWTMSLESYFAGLGQIYGGFMYGMVAAIATIPFAYLSYRYVELPFMRIGGKVTARFSRG